MPFPCLFSLGKEQQFFAETRQSRPVAYFSGRLVVGQAIAVDSCPQSIGVRQSLLVRVLARGHSVHM